MARPRQFDEIEVLDAAVQCFWAHGYEATSVRDLIDKSGIAGASLYNAFGDKRTLYKKALDRYVQGSVAERIERCGELSPRRAISAFFAEIVERSLADPEHKGCMLVNAAFDVCPRDGELQVIVASLLARIEGFFERCIEAGRLSGEIGSERSPEDVAGHLLAVLVGLRVLARVRPERALLEGAVRSALATLDGA
jgi:TetR/AcrR family transcriptional repressor of nem operon